MRQIEEKILDTIKAGEVDHYCLSVRDTILINDDCINILLWGYNICTIFPSRKEINISFCDHQTNTTFSRLRAIGSKFGFSVHQENFKIYLAYQEYKFLLNDSEGYKLHQDGKVEKLVYNPGLLEPLNR